MSLVHLKFEFLMLIQTSKTLHLEGPFGGAPPTWSTLGPAIAKTGPAPGHPVLCIFFSQLKLSHIIHYTLVPCFSASASTFFTFYHHRSYDDASYSLTSVIFLPKNSYCQD